jgi:hypothetical protein
MTELNGVSRPELFSGVKEFISRHFGVADYGRRSLLRKHKDTPPSRDVGFELAKGLQSRVELSVESVLSNRVPNHSKESWRMVSPGTRCAAANKPREVGLERALVYACAQSGRTDWWNQIPVASGLLGARAGKKRAIDLVHRRTPAAYDFVELKLESDTPLYAMVEILQYGFLWLASRNAKDELRLDRSSLLDATDVSLSVLAPEAFYCGADYSEFAGGVNEALIEIGKTNKVALSFGGFKQFPPAFIWTGAGESSELCSMLDKIYPS